MKEKKSKDLQWWAYLVGLVLLMFVVPTLMSAQDTVLVIIGIILMIAFAVVSWKFWIRPSIQFIWGKINEK